MKAGANLRPPSNGFATQRPAVSPVSFRPTGCGRASARVMTLPTSMWTSVAPFFTLDPVSKDEDAKVLNPCDHYTSGAFVVENIVAGLASWDHGSYNPSSREYEVRSTIGQKIAQATNSRAVWEAVQDITDQYPDLTSLAMVLHATARRYSQAGNQDSNMQKYLSSIMARMLHMLRPAVPGASNTHRSTTSPAPAQAHPALSPGELCSIMMDLFMACHYLANDWHLNPRLVDCLDHVVTLFSAGASTTHDETLLPVQLATAGGKPIVWSGGILGVSVKTCCCSSCRQLEEYHVTPSSAAAASAHMDTTFWAPSGLLLASAASLRKVGVLERWEAFKPLMLQVLAAAAVQVCATPLPASAREQQVIARSRWLASCMESLMALKAPLQEGGAWQNDRVFDRVAGLVLQHVMGELCSRQPVLMVSHGWDYLISTLYGSSDSGGNSKYRVGEEAGVTAETLPCPSLEWPWGFKQGHASTGLVGAA